MLAYSHKASKITFMHSKLSANRASGHRGQEIEMEYINGNGMTAEEMLSAAKKHAEKNQSYTEFPSCISFFVARELLWSRDSAQRTSLCESVIALHHSGSKYNPIFPQGFDAPVALQCYDDAGTYFFQIVAHEDLVALELDRVDAMNNCD